jgi:DNA invertase Pin-like site-specific DNA recombinase
MSKSRRAGIYARLSFTTEESVSIARQLAACRQYAAARGMEVVLEAVDDGVSATRRAPEDRPGWQQILAAADDLDAVIIWKVDRLARRVIDFLGADKTLQAHGVGIVAVEDPIDMTTAQGRAFATMLAVFGELEAAGISARLTAARNHMIAIGRTTGGRKPWPYETVPAANGVGVEWRPIPERADAIRWAAEEMIAGRTSLRAICREWEKRGLLPAELDKARADVERLVEAKADPLKIAVAEARAEKSAHWPRTTVARILRNPVLAGATINHGEVVRNADGTMRISPERVILDVSTFLQLQAALEERSVVRDPIIERVPTILGDLPICGSCGRRMFQNRTSRPKPYYLCSNDQCGKHAAVSLSIIEPVAERVFLARFGDWRVPERREKPPPPVDPEEVAIVSEALEDVSLALDAPDLEDEEGMRLLRVRRELRVRLAELRDRSATPVKQRLVPYRESEETYAERWATADVAGKAKLLASVWDAIEIAPGVRGKREQPEERFTFLGWDELVAKWGR